MRNSGLFPAQHYAFLRQVSVTKTRYTCTDLKTKQETQNKQKQTKNTLKIKIKPSENKKGNEITLGVNKRCTHKGAQSSLRSSVTVSAHQEPDLQNCSVTIHTVNPVSVHTVNPVSVHTVNPVSVHTVKSERSHCQSSERSHCQSSERSQSIQ